MSVAISAADVKALRERTGAGMLDCREALAEAGGDMDRAIELLRIKGRASAAKRAGREAGEGIVASYVHATGKIGVLVEVNCETDFVARNEAFQEFAQDVALHIAAAAPRYVSAGDIPEDELEAERRIFSEGAREEGKPDHVTEKIVEGRLAKWTREVALLDQEHVNADKHGGKTIDELRTEVAAATGENVQISRFARFEVGKD